MCLRRENARFGGSGQRGSARGVGGGAGGGIDVKVVARRISVAVTRIMRNPMKYLLTRRTCNAYSSMRFRSRCRPIEYLRLKLWVVRTL